MKSNPYLCLVKRYLAISFLTLYAFTATECKQLLKFPILLEHFAEHKKANRNISFFDFLSMHYVGYDLNDNDEDRDMQLPFKSVGDSASTDAQFIPSKAEVVSLTVVPETNQNITIYKRLNFQSAYLSSIWQPPKAA